MTDLQKWAADELRAYEVDTVKTTVLSLGLGGLAVVSGGDDTASTGRGRTQYLHAREVQQRHAVLHPGASQDPGGYAAQQGDMGRGQTPLPTTVTCRTHHHAFAKEAYGAKAPRPLLFCAVFLRRCFS